MGCAPLGRCDVAAWHNIINQSAPLVPCNKSAPRGAPNCPYCCNFSTPVATGAYNEPIGGPWPPNPKSNGTRFGDNALNDGQFFWDFRNAAAREYWAREVYLAGGTYALSFHPEHLEAKVVRCHGGLLAEANRCIFIFILAVEELVD